MSIPKRSGFAVRPSNAAHDPEDWVRAEPETTGQTSRAEIYAARLTIDVTKALRARIKMAAFSRGVTVADMLRALLESQFPEPNGSDR